MKKTLTLIITECSYAMRQESHEVMDGNHCIFSCSNLDDCPEDAIIGRDLFDGYDYIKALKLGMKLAEEGYTEIELETKVER